MNRAINRLRQALGDNADKPRYVETLPGRGYRFVAPANLTTSLVAEVAPAAGEEASPEAGPVIAAQKPALQRRRYLLGIGGLIAIPLFWICARYLRSPGRPIESIAVLPLENLSGDPAQEYVSDGMTNALIGELARIDSLRVISRTSVMRYKGNPRKPLPEIARDLNVNAIVEGTVAHSGERVRITVQLIRAHDDGHLLSEKYYASVPDALSLQDEIARAIAARVEVRLTPQEQISLSRTRKVSPEAYVAFLKGNLYLQRGMRGSGPAIDFFTEALRLDPSFAEAHAGLAQSLIYAGIYGLRSSAETYPQARKAALRALELDQSVAVPITLWAM